MSWDLLKQDGYLLDRCLMYNDSDICNRYVIYMNIYEYMNVNII